MGFQVWYKFRHNGFAKKVYWALDREEAVIYADMVLKNFGHYCDVYIEEGE